MIYLAAPWFNKHELDTYHKVLTKLRSQNLDVYAPMEHLIANAYEMSNEDWGKAVFEEDLAALNQCTSVIVLNYGMYSDTGTAWEAGYAFAKGIPVTMLVDDEYESTYSLMMCNGCLTLNNICNFLEDTNNFLCVEQK